MAFGDTGIKDNFNRADEGPPPSASWTFSSLVGDVNQLAVRTNACESLAGQAGCRWGTVFGPACEVFYTITSITDRMRLFLRCVGSWADGYMVIANPGLAQWQLYRIDGGSATQLGGGINRTFANGQKIGAEMIGSTLAAYIDTGSGWTSEGTRTDATYSAAGDIALVLVASGDRVDDFGGGTVEAGVNITPPSGAAAFAGVAGRMDLGILVPTQVDP